MRLRFGTCVFDSTLRELSRGGVRVPLTPKAWSLLEGLVEARPQPLSREAIVARLWPDAVVEPGNLHNLVAEIRAAIGDADHTVIRTVHRFGYAFDAAGAVEETSRFEAVLGSETIALRGGENLIGRDPSCTISIDSAEVSRRHARLTAADGALTIEDLGSKNGTFVGRKRVTAPESVHPGDEIVVGTTRILIRAVGALPSTKTAI
jgi:DNA-binding winged helix-turn-helix (wHTH) protein